MGSSASKPASTVAASVDEKLTSKLADKVQAMSLESGIAKPTSLDGTLTLSNIDAWEHKLDSNPKTRLARTVLAHTTLPEALIKRDARVADIHVFNHEIKFETNPITNQKSSGRCWLFATTNVIRESYHRAKPIVQWRDGCVPRIPLLFNIIYDENQLSQSYPFFYDKLNKANYYLEQSIQLADLPVDDRLVVHLADDLVSDGGQWDMSLNILESYGVVPQSIYPESATSSSSSSLNKLVKTKLREHALVLRKLSKSLRTSGLTGEQQLMTLRSKKEELLTEVYSIMTATLGKPPKPDDSFVWEYYDVDGKVGRWEGTPKEYFKAFSSTTYSPLKSFSLINDPRNEFGKLYTVDRLGNVVGGRPVVYVNTELENMKSMIVKMIKAGQPVFFGCDVGASSNSSDGIMDTALFDYENTFDFTLSLTKAERLQVKESAMTHAMVISGVHLSPEGKPVRYKVENSWGADRGNKGYFVMTDAWFDEYVYQVVVPKALAPKELVDVLETEPVVLPAWDPMGALA